jgi:hypothetical protein
MTFTDKEGKDKEKDKNAALAVPRLSVCADAQKVDRAKLAQTEVSQFTKNIYFIYLCEIEFSNKADNVTQVTQSL